MKTVLMMLGVVLMVVAGLGLPIAIPVGLFDLGNGVELVTALGKAAETWTWSLGGGIVGFLIFMSNA